MLEDLFYLIENKEKYPEIFISHISKDEKHAEKIAHILKSKGLNYYLDKADELLTGEDSPEIPDYIRGKIGKCDQIIVLVSEFTVNSWWVPWEIGIATEKGLRIATYILGNYDIISLPSFLKTWPILTKIEDIYTYAITTIDTPQILLEGGIETLNDLDKRRSSAHEFHQKLKKKLNQ